MKLLFVPALLAACLVADPARAVTIDRIDVSTVFGYSESYSPGDFNRFGLLGVPYTYHLSDGSSGGPGAGWIPYTNGTVTAEHADAGGVSFEFGAITNWARGPGVLFYHLGQIQDGSGSHWTEGELVPVGPLVLQAEAGSAVAVLQGTARISFSNSANLWGPASEFVGYALPEGAIVPFRAEYTLLDGRSWELGIFDTSFGYTMSGVIDFSSPVPEPSVAWMWLAGLVTTVGLRRKLAAPLRPGRPASSGG